MNMTIAYTGGMQFVAETRGHRITIDLPPGQKGEDSGPTPPELFIASLGSCIGVYVVDYLTSRGLPRDGVRVEMTWEDEKSPARIGTVTANIELPDGIGPEHTRMALKAAQACKIHNTLHHKPEVCVTIANQPEVCLP